MKEEHLGSPLFGDSYLGESGDDHSDDDTLDLVCLDPTKSIHYVPPHPNDPPWVILYMFLHSVVCRGRLC